MDVSYWKKRFNGARRILNPEAEQAETAKLIEVLKAEASQAQAAGTKTH